MLPFRVPVAPSHRLFYGKALLGWLARKDLAGFTYHNRLRQIFSIPYS
jgi:hypothetical protein